MRKALAALLAFALPLGLALEVASCGPTCPTLEACGTTNGSVAGAAGTAGGSSSATCNQLTALDACLDSFCQPADKNPFCHCYKLGFDLSNDTCTCTAFDAATFCRNAADTGVDAGALDCSATTSAVATLCVGVQ